MPIQICARTRNNFMLNMKFAFVGVLVALFACPYAIADVSRSDVEKLEDFHEQVESFLDENAEEIFRLPERIQKLRELERRIRDARDDPEALTGENYAELVVDMIMIVPDEFGFPSAMKKAISVMARIIGALFGGAIEGALDGVRYKFTKLYQAELTTGAPEWEAANRVVRIVAASRQVQLRILLEWKREKLGR